MIKFILFFYGIGFFSQLLSFTDFANSIFFIANMLTQIFVVTFAFVVFFPKKNDLEVKKEKN